MIASSRRNSSRACSRASAPLSIAIRSRSATSDSDTILSRRTSSMIMLRAIWKRYARPCTIWSNSTVAKARVIASETRSSRSSRRGRMRRTRSRNAAWCGRIVALYQSRRFLTDSTANPRLSVSMCDSHRPNGIPRQYGCRWRMGCPAFCAPHLFAAQCSIFEMRVGRSACALRYSNPNISHSGGSQE